MEKLGKSKLFALHMPESMLAALRSEARRLSARQDADISASELIRDCIAIRLQSGAVDRDDGLPGTPQIDARRDNLCRAQPAASTSANATAV